MTKNRLRLDFSLDSATDRAAFLEKYLRTDEFVRHPPTTDELTQMGDYILWGKDIDGESAVQKNEIQIETRNKTWQKKEAESLDALLESPTFSENSLLEPTEARHTIPRTVFSRQEIRREAPPHLLPVFEDLFKRIDTLELLVALYDLRTGKRTREVRPELLRRFSEEELEAARHKAESLSQYKYLKLKHLLVELRREQYTLKDFYKSQIQLKGNHGAPLNIDDAKPLFDVEVLVFPVGVATKELPIFPKDGDLGPEKLSEEEISRAIHLLWEKRELFNVVSAQPKSRFFDFRNLEHVYELFGLYFELEDAAALEHITPTLRGLLETLWFYVRTADLSDVQKEILDLKIKKTPNQEVAAIVNKKYGKSYTTNYISTIFRQKIIPRINSAATRHEKVVENLCFEENFKKCTCCGKTLLISTDNFIRKNLSKDGFATRCKICDRNERNKKKGV